MEQSETTLDLAPRKLARQLDFTAGDPSHLKPPPSHSPLRLQLDLRQEQRHITRESQVMPQLQAPRPKLVSPVSRIAHPVQKISVKMLQVV